MKVYDHPTVVAAFPELKGWHISALKSQLYRQLLEILASNPVGNATSLSIRFAEVDFLMHKGLLEQAYEHCLFAITEAREAEEFDTIRRLFPIRWELEELIGNTVPQSKWRTDYEVYEWSNNQLGLITVLDGLFQEVMAIRSLPVIEREAKVKETLLKNPDFSTDESVRAKVLRLRIAYAIALWAKGDLAAAERLSKEIFELLIRHRKLLNDPEAKAWLFKSAKAMISFLIAGRNIREAEQNIKRLKAFANNLGVTEANNVHYYSASVYLQLFLSLNESKVEEGRSLVNNLIALFEKEDASLPFRLFTDSINLATAFSFLHHDYSHVLQLVSIATTKGRQRMFSEELVVAMQLYRLATLFDTANIDLLESSIRSTTSTLKNLGILEFYPVRMLSFFSAICDDSLPENVVNSLNQLQVDLHAFFQDSAFKKYRDAFPIQLWLRSHLEKKSITDLYRSSFT